MVYYCDSTIIIMNMKPKQYSFTILGAPQVGKSNIASRFYEDSFTEDYDPTLEGTFTKSINLDGEKFKVTVTDTAGQEDFISLNEVWMYRKQGFIFVFDITKEHTYQQALRRLEQTRKSRQQKRVPCILVGNKIDLQKERKVYNFKAENKAKQFQSKYIECSAKERINIKEIFNELIKENQLLRLMEDKDEPQRKGLVDSVADICEEKCCVF